MVVCLGILSFRKIIPPLTAQGYGVIAPELLGYGGTARPTDVSSYLRFKMGHSFKDLLATEGLDKVIVLGHDAVSIYGVVIVTSRLCSS